MHARQIPRITPTSPPHLPRIFPTSPAHLPRISHASPTQLPIARTSPIYPPPSQTACASFTETLGNLQSELEDLDAYLASGQLSAEYHPKEATERSPQAGYDHRNHSAGYHSQEAGYLFATSQLAMTSPTLLAHLRRATSLISSISVTASPAKPMAQARHGIEF